MGNREDLLAGALECLKEKGWARTTVRDIATAAKVNHAAIGYHFGSREALMTEAFIEAMAEWGAELGTSLEAAVDPTLAPRQQYEAFWRQAIASYSANRRLWLASIEAAVEAEHSPKIRELIREGLRQARSGLAAGILGVHEAELDSQSGSALGSIQLALMSGLLIQHLVDPDQAPNEQEITNGLLALADHITEKPAE